MQTPVPEPPKVPTLYHVHYFCSSIPYAVALELSIPDDQLKINHISNTTLRADPEIGALSQRRVAPFVHFPDGSVLLEAGAIVLYLCETFDKDGKLHPLPGTPGRNKFLQAVVYTAAECYRAVVNVFLCCYGRTPDQRDEIAVVTTSQKYHKIVTKHLLTQLEGKKYYLGDQFSVADIMFGYILMTAEVCDVELLEDQSIREYHDRIKARPSYQEVFGLESSAAK